LSELIALRIIIPVAGQGTRLRPHTEKRQKVLLPVGGKPILDRVLQALVAAGISDVSFVIGHLGDQVREHMAGYHDLQVTYVEQSEQRGLGEAVYLALLAGYRTDQDISDEPIVIILADTILELDYDDFFNSSKSLIGVVEVENPGEFGIVETAGRRVVGLVEKPAEPSSNLAIGGIYRIGSQRRLRQALENLIEGRITTRGEYQLTDALALMVEQGEEFLTFPIDRWLDCGTEKTLLETNSYLLESSGGCFIHPEAIVEHSTIRSGSIMENCRISNSTLENCIVLPDAQLESCYINGEIVEERAGLNGYHSSQ